MLLAAGTAPGFTWPANGVGQGQYLANGRVKVYSVLDAVIDAVLRAYVVRAFTSYACAIMPCLASLVSSLGRKQRTYSTLAEAGVTVTRT